jgi:phosphoglycolate phosphatase-like HAD superfamily hydrolase
MAAKMHKSRKRTVVDVPACAFCTSSRLIFLDFDGVLCDSAAETAVAAWRAGAALWPEWCGPEPSPAALARFCELRPLLETGYQAIALLRLIVTGEPDARITAEFAPLTQAVFTSAGWEKPALVRLFGDTRDRWIREDEAGWLRRHRFYPGTAAAVRRVLDAGHPLFILTTKQARFTEKLLRASGVPLPPEAIFGLESGKSKEDTLAEFVRNPQFAGRRCHFIEDRLDTLERVMARPELASVALYFATWGYSLPAERARATAFPHLTCWSLTEFLQIPG